MIRFLSVAVVVAISLSSANGASLIPLPERDTPERQLRDTGHLLPAYQLWITEMTCANSRYGAEISMSKVGCARQMSALSHSCSRLLGQRMPRNESREVNGRMRYRGFVEAFQNCLKAHFAAVKGSPIRPVKSGRRRQVHPQGQRR